MSKAYITTFSYDCEIAFNSIDGKDYPILKDYVKYIVVDHDYKNRIMPIIYIKVNIPPTIYNKMVPQQGRSKIYLKLYRTRKKGATSSAPKKVIYDEFDYFMTDDPNAYRKLDEINKEEGTVYKTCKIGLIKIDFQKQNQRSFEGIFKNTNTMSLVQSATSHMKMVIQPFKNNTHMDIFPCPVINSVGQFISYINSKHKFYDASYIYYIDFDKTYLRSNDGSYIDAKDGDLKYIAFDIRDLTSYQALTTGMVEDIDQDAYIIYVPGSDAQIIIDRTTSQLVGNIQVVDASSGEIVGTSYVNTKNITGISSDSTLTLTSNDPKNAYNIASQISESSDMLVITKLDMDSRVFTPNKQYLLSNYEDNPKFCGIYYLVSKKEIYLRTGDQLTSQITLTLKKCANFSKNK